MSTSGYIMSTLRVFSTSGGYHEYIRACSVHRGFQYKLKGFCHLAPPHASYPPEVLMISLDVLIVSLDVLMVSP